MGCKFEFYKKEEKYCPKLYCSITDGQCIYSKRCLKLDKFIPLDGEKWKECYRYNMEMQKEIPSGASFVQLYRANRKGDLILYVVLDKGIEKIQTNLKQINQNYVYVREGLDGYEVSLTPFPQKNYVKSKSVQRREAIQEQEQKRKHSKNIEIEKEEEKEFSGLIEED